MNMKTKLIVVLLAFSTMTFAQAEVDFHKITLQDKKDVALAYNFSVEKVIDGRQFKQNIGTVQKGAFNRKVLANFESPLADEFMNYLGVICPTQEGKSKIIIRIDDLYVSELTRAMSETGYATIVLDVIEVKEGVAYVVGTYNATTERNGMDVTNKHDERIKKVLQECLNEYAKTSDKDKTVIVFDSNQKSNIIEYAGAPKKGVYLSYSDVINNKPIDDSNFEISNKNEKFYIMNKTTNSKEMNYYGFSDGTTFYINISKYANLKYYAKTEIIAGKYYIENVMYNATNVAAMSAMFGLVGALIATSDSSIPMLIDRNSGQPLFLSKNEIKTMLSPYPELLKEYKSSNKTNEDIKNILVKYYSESQTKQI